MGICILSFHSRHTCTLISGRHELKYPDQIHFVQIQINSAIETSEPIMVANCQDWEGNQSRCCSHTPVADLPTIVQQAIESVSERIPSSRNSIIRSFAANLNTRRPIDYIGAG